MTSTHNLSKPIFRNFSENFQNENVQKSFYQNTEITDFRILVFYEDYVRFDIDGEFGEVLFYEKYEIFQKIKSLGLETTPRKDVIAVKPSQ